MTLPSASFTIAISVPPPTQWVMALLLGGSSLDRNRPVDAMTNHEREA
jgi:hypothetical protein